MSPRVYRVINPMSVSGDSMLSGRKDKEGRREDLSPLPGKKAQAVGQERVRGVCQAGEWTGGDAHVCGISGRISWYRIEDLLKPESKNPP